MRAVVAIAVIAMWIGLLFGNAATGVLALLLAAGAGAALWLVGWLARWVTTSPR